MKKFFSINVYEEEGCRVFFHDTLEEAKKSALDGARELYNWAFENECLDDVDVRDLLSEAVYGEIKGRVKLITRKSDKSDDYEKDFDFIYEGLTIIQENDWILKLDFN